MVKRLVDGLKQKGFVVKTEPRINNPYPQGTPEQPRFWKPDVVAYKEGGQTVYVLDPQIHSCAVEGTEVQNKKRAKYCNPVVERFALDFARGRCTGS